MRPGSANPLRPRRAMLPLASIGGSTTPAIAPLVQTDEDTIGDAIHRFNEIGLACLNPHWAGDRPHPPDSDDEDFAGSAGH